MKILLDTHHVLWLTVEPERFVPSETAVIDDSATELSVSAVSIWELHLKWHRLHRSGDRKGPVDPADLLDRLDETGIGLIPLTPTQAAGRLDVNIEHGDPFDRLLLLQAQDIGARLLTRDRLLQRHPLVLQL